VYNSISIARFTGIVLKYLHFPVSMEWQTKALATGRVEIRANSFSECARLILKIHHRYQMVNISIRARELAGKPARRFEPRGGLQPNIKLAETLCRSSLLAWGVAAENLCEAVTDASGLNQRQRKMIVSAI
jgi:hypothetical protein